MSTTATATGRKYLDCSEFPSESNCSLKISGTEDEVMAAATHHAATIHGHDDTPEFRDQLRGMLKEE